MLSGNCKNFICIKKKSLAALYIVLFIAFQTGSVQLFAQADTKDAKSPVAETKKTPAIPKH